MMGTEIKRRIRKTFAVLTAGLLVLVMVSCSGQNNSESAVEEKTTEETKAAALSGGWQCYAEGEASLPKEVAEAFEKATEGFTGSELTPVAYVGQQVVAGMNYMILCRCKTTAADPAVSFQMITVYADLEGNSEILSMKDFAYEEMTGGETPGEYEEPKAEVLSGGWNIPDDYTVGMLPEEVQAAFDKATESLTGAGFTPMAYLGSQIVAGTNYALLCCGEGSARELGTSLQVIVIYADLEGNAQITGITTVNMTDYTE